MMASKRTGLTTAETLVVVVLMAAAVGIGYLVFGQSKAAPQNRQSVGDSPSAAPSPDAAASANEARRKAGADALAAKQAEDARRQEADRLAQAERERVSSIHGAAWVVRNNGDSSILRGLHIHLLRPSFSDDSPFRESASTSTPFVAQLRELCVDTVNKSKEKIKSENDAVMASIDQESIDTFQPKADLYSTRLDMLRQLIGRPPGRIEDVQAYRLLLAASLKDKVDFPYSSVLVADTDADVEGKYTIPNVAPGDYCVFANFDSGMIAVDWLLPIHIAPGTSASLDLNNDNAIHIQNETP